ncbi:unnamed protein product [Cunninghamella blakesleeana]
MIEHQPKVEFDLVIGAGSQDLITKAIEMLIHPGDAILVENPAYTGLLAFVQSQPCDVIGLDTDNQGLIPESFEFMMANWPSSNPYKKEHQSRPKVLYTTPIGSNPTGLSISEERKKRIYAICQKYDIMIVEDLAYYYLQFDENRTKSFFSMDVDGRVLCCESMSKIISSGLRLGWISGPKVLIERINMHTMTTNLQPSGIPQLMAYSLLNNWGYEGFFQHIRQVADFYKEKRDLFIASLNQYMKGRAEWVTPSAGMFVWLKLKNISNSYDLIMKKALKKKVVAIPGNAFMPMSEDSPYVRVSFSNVSKDDMDEALRRLAQVLDEEIENNPSI